MPQKIRLSNGIITLRQYKLSDVEEMHAATLESINELIPWMPWCHEGYSIEESRKYVEEHAGGWQIGITYDFAITDAKSGFYLGGCGINHINTSDNFANLGYWIRSTQTGKGIATTAASLVARFGIETLKLNRIEIVIAVENKASQRVATKVGAAREGILRNRLSLPGDKIIIP
jgi:ribosomal-protein-serine acetyltransferase